MHAGRDARAASGAAPDLGSAGSLAGRGHWIFDMDGTLTVAMHDFDAMREALGLPPGEPILEALERLDRTDPARAGETRDALDAMELEMAHAAREQPGARALLEALLARGVRIGILTRNGRAIADATLAAAGLDDLFAPEFVVGRECAEPKPDPAGVRLLLARWGTGPDDALVVGDGRFDLEAAVAAGCPAVHFDPEGRKDFPEVAALKVVALDALMAHAAAPA